MDGRWVGMLARYYRSVQSARASVLCQACDFACMYRYALRRGESPRHHPSYRNLGPSRSLDSSSTTRHLDKNQNLKVRHGQYTLYEAFESYRLVQFAHYGQNVTTKRNQ